MQEHEIILYQLENTNVYVNVIFKEETFWMTQRVMAELFDCTTKKAEKEYEAFRVKQDKEYISEFDREIEKYLKGDW